MNTLIALVLSLLSTLQLSSIDITEDQVLLSFANHNGPVYVVVYDHYYHDNEMPFDYQNGELLDACEFYKQQCILNNNVMELTAVQVWMELIGFLGGHWESYDWISLKVDAVEDGSFVISGCLRSLQCGNEMELPK